MKKTITGFTIVELLIVIVVIAILAAISIAAYTGIQQRAHNTQTVNAVAAWVKALKLYHADKGKWPMMFDTCLGEADQYPYDFTAATNGDNQCRYTSAAYYNVKPNFVNLMRDYIGEGTLPTPSMSAIGTSTTWYRGAMYLYSIPTPGVVRLSILYVVTGNNTQCTDVAGITATRTVMTGGALCSIMLGDQPV